VLQPDDVRRLKQFEQENARLKKLLEARSRNRAKRGAKLYSPPKGPKKVFRGQFQQLEAASCAHEWQRRFQRCIQESNQRTNEVVAGYAFCRS
jgi:hypothetical protein